MLPIDHEQSVERNLAAVTITRCLCGTVFHGTAAEGIAWHRQHRATNHPEWVDRGQRTRRNAAKSAPVSYWSSRATTLTEL